VEDAHNCRQIMIQLERSGWFWRSVRFVYLGILIELNWVVTTGIIERETCKHEICWMQMLCVKVRPAKLPHLIFMQSPEANELTTIAHMECSTNS
jgi:hypothetical protein